jgi:hypothetical protein
LEQERFGRSLLSLFGGGCRVSYRPKNNPNHPCVTTLSKFINDRIIIVGDLQSIDSHLLAVFMWEVSSY